MGHKQRTVGASRKSYCRPQRGRCLMSRRGKSRSRIYWRNRGGQRRAYVDLRDIGGGREALKVKGEKLATADPDIAAELAARRVKELEGQRRRKVLLGVERLVTLAPFVEHHIREKAKAAKVTDRWVDQTLRQLEAAVDFFGKDRD